LLLLVYFWLTAKTREKTARSRHIPKQIALRKIAGLFLRSRLWKPWF